MAEKDANINLDESADVGSVLNVMQDNMVTTNENVENVGEITNVNETVGAECSRNNEVNIFNQLALIMEVMNNKFDQQNKNNDNLNTSLNEFKTEMLSLIHI